MPRLYSLCLSLSCLVACRISCHISCHISCRISCRISCGISCRIYVACHAFNLSASRGGLKQHCVIFISRRMSHFMSDFMSDFMSHSFMSHATAFILSACRFKAADCVIFPAFRVLTARCCGTAFHRRSPPFHRLSPPFAAFHRGTAVAISERTIGPGVLHGHRPLHCDARRVPAGAVPQSLQQTWTVLPLHGPDHLGLWLFMRLRPVS